MPKMREKMDMVVFCELESGTEGTCNMTKNQMKCGAYKTNPEEGEYWVNQVDTCFVTEWQVASFFLATKWQVALTVRQVYAYIYIYIRIQSESKLFKTPATLYPG